MEDVISCLHFTSPLADVIWFSSKIGDTESSPRTESPSVGGPVMLVRRCLSLPSPSQKHAANLACEPANQGASLNSLSCCLRWSEVVLIAFGGWADGARSFVPLGLSWFAVSDVDYLTLLESSLADCRKVRGTFP